MQKHVAVLERAELVSKHRVGRESIVRAESKALKRAHTALDRLESEWRGRIERIDLGMEQGMVEALGQIDALLASGPRE